VDANGPDAYIPQERLRATITLAPSHESAVGGSQRTAMATWLNDRRSDTIMKGRHAAFTFD